MYHSRFLPSILSFAGPYLSEGWSWGDACAQLYNTKGVHLRRLAALWILRRYCLIGLEHQLRIIFCIGWNATKATDEYMA